MTKQNKSSAVMQQRKEPHDSLDFFPTMPWATRALCHWIETNVEPLDCRVSLEPACGEGHMARPMKEFFATVHASDVHDYGYGRVSDFLMPLPDIEQTPHWVITNPPFRLAEQFIEQACGIASIGVAMIVRTAFLESVGRYQNLFSKNPPSDILQFTERVPMHKGKIAQHGSTATAYCWIIWRRDIRIDQTRFHWIPPCRKRLERPEDYECGND